MSDLIGRALTRKRPLTTDPSRNEIVVRANNGEGWICEPVDFGPSFVVSDAEVATAYGVTPERVDTDETSVQRTLTAQAAKATANAFRSMQRRRFRDAETALDPDSPEGKLAAFMRADDDD